MSKVKEYIDNQCLPKMSGAELTRKNLWDSADQMEKYPHYFERWTMNEAELRYNEQIRLGHSVDDWSVEVMPEEIMSKTETKKPKEEEKLEVVQLTLSL